MASFYAELEVDGHAYPVRWCRFGFEQAINERGRARGKVRHGLLHLRLDVPDGDQLLAWAHAPRKPLAGHVTFFETNRLTARETVGFAAGECVGYEETFVSGAGGDGAYVCLLTIAARKLELTPGGPARALVPAAVRDYAAPVAAAQTKWKGGAGLDGMGDTTGTFSGRRFDPDNCGGPIIKADWRKAAIRAEGIKKVQTHISRYGPDADNEAMVERLQQISQGQLAATEWDKRFYTHELREYERYQALGIADGIDPGREVWNNAHTATLEDFGLADYAADGSHNLYHPDL